MWTKASDQKADYVKAILKALGITRKEDGLQMGHGLRKMNITELGNLNYYLVEMEGRIRKGR